MQAYAPTLSGGAFDRSRECFESIIGLLADPETGQHTHAELEERLSGAGRELMRLLVQDHLDLRADQERLPVFTGPDGIERRVVDKGHTRSLTTIFGSVTVTRLAYRAKGAPNVHPADAALNLPPVKHPHGLQKLAAIESVRGSFAAAEEAIERSCGVRLGKRQIQELTRAAAVDIDTFYAAMRPAPAGDDELLVLSMDGKGIVMRPGALRTATAQAAQKARTKLTTRLSRGEKRNRKPMAEVGTVYDAAPVPRTPEQVITVATGQDSTPGPVATGKWLTASVARETAAVIEEVFAEATRRDPEHHRCRVVLVDGNSHQIDLVQAEAKRRKVRVHIVVDFVHVLEYLWRAAWCFFAEGAKIAEAWVGKQARRILAGRSGVVVAAIRRMTTWRDLMPDKRARVESCVKYLVNKRSYLRYDQALERGWPIATGVIEGACRHLVTDRMDITGARWGLAGAEAVLKLRAMIANGDFDRYWAFHLRQEYRRVHGVCYRQDLVLAA
jgi:hypothetical protein